MENRKPERSILLLGHCPLPHCLFHLVWVLKISQKPICYLKTEPQEVGVGDENPLRSLRSAFEGDCETVSFGSLCFASWPWVEHVALNSCFWRVLIELSSLFTPKKRRTVFHQGPNIYRRTVNTSLLILEGGEVLQGLHLAKMDS